MLFRQLIDRATCTYSYLLADEASREAVLVDPVREQHERDATLIQQLGLTLLYSLETHVHADHVTGAALLRERLGCRTVIASCSGARADFLMEHGDRVTFGRHVLEARCTPGHTSGCTTWVIVDESMAFTGDALFVRGCGRTDFQEGDPRTLYRSVHEQIFSLPPHTLLWPGHDYKGHTVTTVAEELAFNPRLGGGRSEEEFIAIMEGLELAPPQRIDEAVPANLQGGRRPE